MNFISRFFHKPEKVNFFPFHLYNVMHQQGCKCYKCQGNPDSFGMLIMNKTCQICRKNSNKRCGTCANLNVDIKICLSCIRPFDCEACSTKLKAIREYQSRVKVNIEPVIINS